MSPIEPLRFRRQPLNSQSPNNVLPEILGRLCQTPNLPPAFHRNDLQQLTRGLSLTANQLSSQAMHRDHQCWCSPRLNRQMGIAIYGNYGAPILAFPTSCGDEWEMEGQGMI